MGSGDHQQRGLAKRRAQSWRRNVDTSAVEPWVVAWLNLTRGTRLAGDFVGSHQAARAAAQPPTGAGTAWQHAEGLIGHWGVDGSSGPRAG